MVFWAAEVMFFLLLLLVVWELEGYMAKTKEVFVREEKKSFILDFGWLVRERQVVVDRRMVNSIEICQPNCGEWRLWSKGTIHFFFVERSQDHSCVWIISAGLSTSIGEATIMLTKVVVSVAKSVKERA
jgi:hypothetical protein